MKTIKEWLKEGLSKEDYKKAEKYKTERWETNQCADFEEALWCGFSWIQSEEGVSFWENISLGQSHKNIPETIDEVVFDVRKDLLERSQIGINKYGTTLDRNDIDLKGWLQHLYEELLDASCYVKRAMKEIDNEI